MLQRIRKSSLRWLGQLCLAALLLVPVLLSAHHHAGPSESRNCAVCVAVHHAPAATTAAAAVNAPLLAMALAPIAVETDAAGVSVQPLGRGPPAAPLHPNP